MSPIVLMLSLAVKHIHVSQGGMRDADQERGWCCTLWNSNTARLKFMKGLKQTLDFYQEGTAWLLFRIPWRIAGSVLPPSWSLTNLINKIYASLQYIGRQG